MTRQEKRPGAGGTRAVRDFAQAGEQTPDQSAANPGTLTVARLSVTSPHDFIITLAHDPRSNRWVVTTKAGVIELSSHRIYFFGAFARQCSRKLGVIFRRRPTENEWIRIIDDLLKPLRGES